MKKHFYYLAVLAMFFTACKDSDEDRRSLDNKPRNPVEEQENTNNEQKVTKEIFSGYAQKGPFINGSSVTISELKPNLDQTGRTYFTTIANNSGSFELKNIELNSHYADLKVDGYYFNEISGKTSAGQMTLYAIVDVKDVNSANVNVLTHLEKPRVEYLVKQEKKSFSDAKKQAQREVLAIFGFEPTETSSETLDLTDNAALLAISCILQGYLSTGDMMELMAKIADDIRTDGLLSDTNLGSCLASNANALFLTKIRDNVEKKYTELKIATNIPNFESLIHQFLEKNPYKATSLVKFPEYGEFILYSPNLLAENNTEFSRNIWYPIAVEVPEGMTYRIAIRSNSTNFVFNELHDYPFGMAPTDDWIISSKGEVNSWVKDADGVGVDITLRSNGSGKLAEFGIQFWGTQKYTFKCYENGSSEPSYVKTITPSF